MDENDERKWIIWIIEEGSKSDYWKLIKKVVNEWIADEHKRLNYYKQSGIKNDEIEKYNRTVDRLRYLNKFLTINEVIVNYNRSFIDKLKEKAEELFHVGESFVGRFKKWFMG